MTQASRPVGQHINNYANGDSGPYSSAEWRAIFAALFTQDPTTQGPLINYLNELEVTSGGANSISVDTGAAVVNGNIFLNTSSVSFTPTSAPAGQTRYDRVVVMLNDRNTTYTTNLTFPSTLTDYASASAVQEYACRLAILRGTAGAGAPSLVQSGATYMIPLAQYIINDAGTISSVTDQRTFARFSTAYLKTKSFLVPHMGQSFETPAFGQADEQAGGYSDARGAEPYDSYDGIAMYAGFSVPSDYLSGMTATILLNSSGAAMGTDYRFYARVRHGAVGEQWDVHDQTWGWTTWSDTGANGELVEVHSFTLSNVAVGDIVSLYFRRDADHAEDTGHSYIQSPGWMIEYTASPLS